MPRQVRSDVQLLLEEVRALEMLADDADVPAPRLQEYWGISADLITLAADIEEFQTTHPESSYDDPEMLSLKRRLRDIASRLSVLTLE